MQLPCFNVFREMFYMSNVKVVPNNIYDLLTPKGLAFWIMDDGSRQGDGLPGQRAEVFMLFLMKM
jgi:hypothetical protein